MTTAAPAALSPLAIPSPIPPFPPVTKATRFCRLNIVITISLDVSEDSGLGGDARQSSSVRGRRRFATVGSRCQTVDGRRGAHNGDGEGRSGRVRVCRAPAYVRLQARLR